MKSSVHLSLAFPVCMMHLISSLMTFLLLCQSLDSYVSAEQINLWSYDSPIYPGTDSPAGWTSRLGKPLIGDDGLVYICSWNKVYAFRGNGTIAWRMHLGSTCNAKIAPVHGGDGIIYLVAENRVLRISWMIIGSYTPMIQPLIPQGMDDPWTGEIMGLTSSIITSSIYVNRRRQGIIAYSFRGKQQWRVGPVFSQFEYLQTCRRNVTDCYFDSAVAIDHCEGSIYVSNNQGEVYSLSVRNARLKWVQDFILFNERFIMTPGNNGRLYVTIPAKSVLFALDASNGDILWSTNIGPLSSTDYEPVVDANGWMSIGSLDGFLYSFSPTGELKKFSRSSSSDSVIQVSPNLDCSGYAVYISETQMEGKRSIIASEYNFVSASKPRNVAFTLLVPATGSLYWSERYTGPYTFNLSHSDLRSFAVDEAIILTFISASNAGNPLSCRSSSPRMVPSCLGVRSKPLRVYTADERTIYLFLIIQTAILVALAITVRFCWIFWSKKKLQDRGLDQFLEKRRSLCLMKKEYDQTIKELEQKVTEESIPGMIDKLRDMVREKNGVERKLSTTYSLGQDSINVRTTPPKSILPLYKGKERSHSFQTRCGKESVTIFHSESDSDCSSYEWSTEAEEGHKEEELEDLSGKGKKPIEVDDDDDDDDDDEGDNDEAYGYDGDGDFSSFGSGSRPVNKVVISGGASEQR